MIIYAIGLIVQITGAVLLAMSVNLDCEGRSIKAKGLYTDLSFFFGLFGFLFYYIVRDKAKQKEYPELTTKEKIYIEYENIKKCKKANTLFYVSLLFLAVQVFLNINSIMTGYKMTNFIEDVISIFVK